MKLTDLATPEEYRNIQQLFSMVTGLTSVTFGLDGMPVTTPEFQNDYCAKIKASKEGARLCFEAHRAITEQVLKKGTPLVAKCKAGLLKVVVPIQYEGEIIGVTGGCGVYLKSEGLDFEKLIEVGQHAGISREEVYNLAETIKGIDRETIEEEIDILNSKINALVSRKKEKMY